MVELVGRDHPPRGPGERFGRDVDGRMHEPTFGGLERGHPGADLEPEEGLTGLGDANAWGEGAHYGQSVGVAPGVPRSPSP